MVTSLSDIQAEIKKNEEQLAKLRQQAEEYRTQERAGIIEELRQKIAEYGLTAADLKLSIRSSKSKAIRSPAAAKFRGPNGETWSGGRGRKPRWVTDVLAAGNSLSEFEIK